MLLEEKVPPEELDEGIAEKLHPQSVVILLEDKEQRMLLLCLVCTFLGGARE